MDLSERVGWLILGMLAGFILGYIVRGLREIKEELHEVDEIVKGHFPDKNERGAATAPRFPDQFKEWKNIALLIVVLLCAYAAFSSQKNSNDLQNAQDSVDRVSGCNMQFQARTIDALNERTAYTQEQATANVELQKAQAEFLSLLFRQPPEPEKARRDAAQSYLEALTHFVDINSKAAVKVESNPYPTNKEFAACLNQPATKENPK